MSVETEMSRSRNLTNPPLVEALVEESDSNERLFERHPLLKRLGLTVYTPEGLELFMNQPQPRFGGKTARELVVNGQVNLVLAALAEDHDGLGS